MTDDFQPTIFDLSETELGMLNLEEAAAVFAHAYPEVKLLEAKMETLKVRLRDLTRAAYGEPEESTTFELPHRVTVTTTDPKPPPPLKAGQFFDEVPPDVFKAVLARWLKKVKVPAGDFDQVAFEQAVTEERVNRDQLGRCLGDRPDPRSWAVGLKK